MKLTREDLKALSIYLQERKTELVKALAFVVGDDNSARADIESRLAFINATQDKIYFELYEEVG